MITHNSLSFLLINTHIFLLLVFPVDYNSVSTIMPFGGCDSRQCTEIHIVLDDMVVEMTESFFVTIERTPALDNRIYVYPDDGEVEITNKGVYISCTAILPCISGLL